MKWIKDRDGDYININAIERIAIHDFGKDYTKPYRILCEFRGNSYEWKRCASSDEAQEEMDCLIRKVEKHET